MGDRYGNERQLGAPNRPSLRWGVSRAALFLGINENLSESDAESGASAAKRVIVMQFTFMERLQNDSSRRSNPLLKEFGTLRPNLEKSNPEFAYAECLIFLTPFITSSRFPRSSL